MEKRFVFGWVGWVKSQRESNNTFDTCMKLSKEKIIISY